MKYICSTCRKAGRDVIVEVEDGERPGRANVHKAHQGFGLGNGTHNPEDMIDYTHTLRGWMEVYGPSRRIALDLDLEEWSNDHDLSAFIILRHKGRVIVLNPQALPDHMSVDAHGFIGDNEARIGVFVMDSAIKGSRVTFHDDKLPGKSHGWPAASMPVLLLGKQS